MRSLSLIITILLLAACTQPDQPQTTPADLVLSNAFVYTVDKSRTVAESVAIRGNEIVYVGDDTQAKAFIGEETEVLDLDGRLLLPGLHDMHIHAGGIVEPDMCDFRGEARSLDELVPFLKGCIDRYAIADGEWLVVLQWPFSRGNQPGETLKTMRQALDAASDKHPIIMWGDDGHHAAVNSLALAQAKDRDGNIVGLTKQTIDEVFSDFREMIAVDELGEPTGGLNEGARMLVRSDFFSDMMGMNSAVETMMPSIAANLAATGITSIHDPLSGPEMVERYVWLEESGEMTFRVRTGFFHEAVDSHSEAGLDQISAHVDLFKSQREALQNSKLIQPNGVKLFADAVLEGNPFASPPTLPVAAVLNGFKQPIFSIDPDTKAVEVTGYVDQTNEPCTTVREQPDDYLDAATVRIFSSKHGHHPSQCIPTAGVLEHSEAYISAYVREMTEAGFHVHIHALSDHGVRAAVNAFEAVKETADRKGLTQSITHVQLAHPDDVKRLGELGIYVAFTYVWIFPSVEYETMVVPFIDQVDGVADLYNPDHYYMQNVYPVKSVLDSGGILTWGSDTPVSSRNPMPFQSMQAGITRESDGIVMNTSQRVSVHDLIAAYTINGARMMGHDDRLGSIEVGKTADLIVLNQNVVELAEKGQADAIGETLVDITIFDGALVYSRTE